MDVPPLKRGLLTALIALGATLGVVVNFRTEGGESSRSTQTTATDSGTPLSRERALELVNAAADEAQEAQVAAVMCPKSVEAGEVNLSPCAVTFDGPSCQLWMAIRNAEGEEKALPFSEPSQNRRASMTTQATWQAAFNRRGGSRRRSDDTAPGPWDRSGSQRRFPLKPVRRAVELPRPTGANPRNYRPVMRRLPRSS